MNARTGEVVTGLKWTRSAYGPLAGVCEGLGRTLGVNPNLIRTLWALSVLIFGVGLLLYVMLAFALPREDSWRDIHGRKILGVCQCLARRWGWEVGIVRFIALLSLVSSFGLTLIIYLGLYFFLDDRWSEKRAEWRV